jgi:hypothetical protein
MNPYVYGDNNLFANIDPYGLSDVSLYFSHHTETLPWVSHGPSTTFTLGSSDPNNIGQIRTTQETEYGSRSDVGVGATWSKTETGKACTATVPNGEEASPRSITVPLPFAGLCLTVQPIRRPDLNYPVWNPARYFNGIGIGYGKGGVPSSPVTITVPTPPRQSHPQPYPQSHPQRFPNS